MGGFAAFYGSICKSLVGRTGTKDEDASLSRVFLIEFGSACLSMVVGIVWLTLLAVGQLDIAAP
jgi:mevalonate pyrophosphate decarboxylase